MFLFEVVRYKQWSELFYVSQLVTPSIIPYQNLGCVYVVFLVIFVFKFAV